MLRVLLFSLASVITLSGCQIPYLTQNAIGQYRLLAAREPIQDLIKKDQLDSRIKEKLDLVLRAREFAKSDLGLKLTESYMSYVQLDRPYVTYVVNAAPKNHLENYTWWFPIIGSVPYKGFFSEDDAKAEALKLSAKNYDTFVRGVSAYSTLGWFNDPITSAMLNYSQFELVDTIIHESLHSTVYVTGASEFNERLATFVGQIGAELFFKKIEGKQSETLQTARAQQADEMLFREFIQTQIARLDKAYQTSSVTNRNSEFSKIREEFESTLVARLKDQKFIKYLRKQLSPDVLNNARLMLWKLYETDHKVFADLYKALGNNFSLFIGEIEKIKSAGDPEKQLEARVRDLVH